MTCPYSYSLTTVNIIGSKNKAKELEEKSSNLDKRLQHSNEQKEDLQNQYRTLKEENLNFSCDISTLDKHYKTTKAELENAKFRMRILV